MASEWRLAWTRSAERDLAGLDLGVARRVAAKLEACLPDPTRSFRRLVGHDEHKLRVGDHRVLALLDHVARRVIVLRVGHRSSVYDR